MLKLLYVSLVELPSSASQALHVVRMCEAFAAVGCDVTAILPRSSGRFKRPRAPEIFSHYQLRESFRLRFLPGVNGVMGQSQFLWEFSQLLPRLQPDLVYTHWAPAALAAKTLSVRAMCELDRPLSQLSLAERAALKAMNMAPDQPVLVLTSAAIREHFAEQKVWPSQRMLVAPLAGESATGSAQIVWPGRDGALRVMCIVSELSKAVLEHVGALASRWPAVDFLVSVASGASDLSWRTATRQYQNLRIHSDLAPKDVLHLLRSSDILLPLDPEPKMIADCLASGRATICLDSPAIQASCGSAAAYLVTRSDVEAWSEAIAALHDSKLRLEFGERAEAVFLQNLTWTERARQILTHPALEARSEFLALNHQKLAKGKPDQPFLSVTK